MLTVVKGNWYSQKLLPRGLSLHLRSGWSGGERSPTPLITIAEWPGRISQTFLGEEKIWKTSYSARRAPSRLPSV